MRSALCLSRTLVTLALGGGDEPLPSEFQIYRWGENPTTKGSLLFDRKSADEIMADYQKHGVDLAIDLEHDSTSPAARAMRADAADARGYTKLEVRADGLWAVGVQWSSDGAARLRDGRQRYISPFCMFDPKTRRIARLVNLALVAQPATDNASPLMAARMSGTMDPKLVSAAIDAIEAGDTAKALDLLKQLVVAAAGGEAADQAEDQTPGDPMAAAELPPPAPSSGEPKPKGDMPMMPGKQSLEVEALAAIRGLRAVQSSLQAELSSLTAEKSARDLTERKGLVAELVALGAETPATAWANADKGELAPRLLSEDLAGLRDRVGALRAAAPMRGPVRPPATVPAQLSAYEASLTAGMNDQQKARFAELRASRRA